MQVPKHPLRDLKAKKEAEQRRAMEDYFDSLQDKQVEVIESKILTQGEQPSCIVTKKGFQTFIHIIK